MEEFVRRFNMTVIAIKVWENYPLLDPITETEREGF